MDEARLAEISLDQFPLLCLVSLPDIFKMLDIFKIESSLVQYNIL